MSVRGVGEILDAVDVVVHRRRDQRRARLGVPQPRDVRDQLDSGRAGTDHRHAAADQVSHQPTLVGRQANTADD